MRNIRLTIQYDGTRYSGWQSQKNSIAVQDIVERAIGKLIGQKTRLIGAARTDARVHAAGQVANFKTATQLSLKNLKNGLNHLLPPDIIVAKVNEVSDDFHAQFDAASKLYRYSLYTGSAVPPFYRNFVTRVPYELDIGTMKREARHLVGRHNFSSFQGAKSMRKDPVRKIRRLDIRKKGKFIYIDVEGDGFLYTMVRVMVGTLIDIGRGYLNEGSIKKIMKTRDRNQAGATAPPHGLCLMRVTYKRGSRR